MLGRYLTIFSTLKEADLALRLKGHQEDFETLLGDTFSEAELEVHEHQLESLAEVTVQPMLEAMSFEDLLTDTELADKMRAFFQRCRSCLVLEHLPFLVDNPFQVTYLVDLLWSFEEVIVDPGGDERAVFRKEFLQELKRFKGMDIYLPQERVRPALRPQAGDPIEELILAIRQELQRLAQRPIDHGPLSERALGLLQVIRQNEGAGAQLLQASGLNAKDFGDTLERLKFFLKGC